MENAKSERKLLSRILKKVYCANSLVATLLRAIGIIASVVLAIVFLKDLDWWLDESVLETLAVLYIFCGMGLLPYWLGGKISRRVENKKRKTMLHNQQLPGEGKQPYCDQLKTISIPDNVTWIAEQAFMDCSGLESVSLSNNLTAISEGTFYGCENLREIVIPDGVTVIEEYAFGDCCGLQEVQLPEGLTTIQNRAFVNCISLTNLSIPDSVELIDGSFEGCEKLLTISLGNGLTTLDGGAFRNCISLKANHNARQLHRD